LCIHSLHASAGGSVPRPVSTNDIVERLHVFPMESYALISNVVKGIALGAGGYVFLEICSQFPAEWMRLVLWMASLAAAIISYLKWSRGAVLANARTNALDSILPLMMGISEFVLFAMLGSGKSDTLWLNWSAFLALHSWFATGIIHNRLQLIDTKQDFEDCLAPLVVEYLGWLRTDGSHTLWLGCAGFVLWFIERAFLLPNHVLACAYVQTGFAFAFLAFSWKPIVDANWQRDRIDRFATALQTGDQESLAAEPAVQNPQPDRSRPSSASQRFRRQFLSVVVPVGGTLILAVQTYILYRQTLLIDKQTEALRLDQSAHIRERIISASEEEASIKRLLTSLEAAANFEINDPNLGLVLKTNDFSPNACLTPHCSQSSLSDALKAATDDHPTLDADIIGGLLRTGAFLARIDTKLNEGLESPKPLDLEKKSDKLAELRTLSVAGVTQCFLDPAKARNLSEEMSRLRLITSNAFFISMPISQPNKYREMSAKFPQVASNTKMGILQIDSAAEDLMRSTARTPAETKISYTFDAFFPVFARNALNTLNGLKELDAQCNATILRDTEALKSMSQGSRH
jgi:hypothetical protein